MTEVRISLSVANTLLLMHRCDAGIENCSAHRELREAIATAGPQPDEAITPPTFSEWWKSRTYPGHEAIGDALQEVVREAWNARQPEIDRLCETVTALGRKLRAADNTRDAAKALLGRAQDTFELSFRSASKHDADRLSCDAFKLLSQLRAVLGS